MIRMFIYCDGGCSNNGMPNAKAYGSIAVLNNDGLQFKRTWDFPDGRTNNEAEYYAFFKVLDYLDAWEKHYKRPIPKYARVYTDSKLMRNQINGSWRTKTENLKLLVKTARQKLKRFPYLRIKLVPRYKIVAVLGH